VRKIAKKCEKFGKNAKNVCDFAKKSMVFAKFLCVLRAEKKFVEKVKIFRFFQKGSCVSD